VAGGGARGAAAAAPFCINRPRGAHTVFRRKIMRIVNIISYILVLLGAVNWGLFGIFDFNLVSAIFSGARSVGSIIIYSIIAAAALWLIISPFLTRGRLLLGDGRRDD